MACRHNLRVGKTYEKIYGIKKARKMRLNLSRNRLGKNNPNWRGDKVGISGLHKWITRHKPKPNFCEDCGKNKPYDIANISQTYKRNINDFKWLCRSCHMKSDGRMTNLKNQ